MPKLKFKEWIKSQTCYICGMYGVDPHHIKRNDGHTRRYDDTMLIPLCRRCHDSVHEKPTLEEKFCFLLASKLLAKRWNEYYFGNEIDDDSSSSQEGCGKERPTPQEPNG